MGSPYDAESARTRGRCEPPRNRFRVSAKQACFTAVGVVLLVVGVVVAKQTLPVGPILISLGGLVLLVGVALPLVHQVQLGAPMLVTVTIAAEEQRVRLHSAIEDCRGLLVACASNLCPDGEAAARAVEASLSKGLGDWHVAETARLRTFLLCLLVREARFEAATHPTSANATDSFLRLPLEEREVLVLLDRAGLDLATVAQMLGLTETQVESMRTRALAAVGAPGNLS